MEDHLKNKDRLSKEWEALCGYEADPCSQDAAKAPENIEKNRVKTALPCESLIIKSQIDLNQVYVSKFEYHIYHYRCGKFHHNSLTLGKESMSVLNILSKLFYKEVLSF